MKDKGISRDVGAGPKRTRGEDPGLGGFVRAGGPVSPEPAPSPKGQRRMRRVGDDNSYSKEEKEKRAKSAMMLWTMLLGGGGVLVVAVCLAFWLFSQSQRSRGGAAAVAAPYVRVEEPPATNKLPEKEGVALAMKAMAARTEEEVLAVIDPGTVPVTEVAAYLRELENREGGITSYDWMVKLDAEREDMAGVVVSFEKEGEKTNRIALFTPDGGGRWMMDFPAFARLATPPWEDFLSGKAESAVVRVYVERDQYFNGPFSEGDGWICYGVASPDVDRLLFGYCKKDSPQDVAIRSLLDVRRMARMTAVLGKAEGADGRQFVIKRVLAHDWLVGDLPADGAGE